VDVGRHDVLDVGDRQLVPQLRTALPELEHSRPRGVGVDRRDLLVAGTGGDERLPLVLAVPVLVVPAAVPVALSGGARRPAGQETGERSGPDGPQEAAPRRRQPVAARVDRGIVMR
jgi:hypothetical protein